MKLAEWIGMHRRCGWGIAGALLGIGGLVFAGRATTADLGGTHRYLTHVSTDKPIYRPGEKVYVRGVLLDALTHSPLPADGQTSAQIEIRGPKGDVVASGPVNSQESVVAFQWDVPTEQAGGEYTVRVLYPWHGHAPAERKFDIRAYRAPRLKSQIVFLRDGYGPGDEVTASLHVERTEGGVPAGAKVSAVARVDGSEVHSGSAAVDGQGNCSVRFKLPKEIARGEGSLAMIIEDGGVVETAAKTIPILLQIVDLTMYPEGGDLVAGLPGRVYIEARTPAKKPADIAGVILNDKGKEVTTFRTEHEGRGRFRITPQKGVTYTLKIREPSGVQANYILPQAKDAGAAIVAMEDMVGRGGPAKFEIGSIEGGQLKLTLCQREVEVSSVSWNAKPGAVSKLYLTPPEIADGVLVATVWDEQGKPLAERLIFREPMNRIRVQVKAEKGQYVPGEGATVSLTTTDRDGKPVSAVLGVTVTDDSVLEMIEKRDQAPRLPVMAFLEPEVQELADAHVYLDPANPKAPLAVDLLLGTQGWRQFAFVDPAKFLAQHGDAARRVLAHRQAIRPIPDQAPGRAGGGEIADMDGGALKDKGAPQAIVPEAVFADAAEPAPAAQPRVAMVMPAARPAEPPAAEPAPPARIKDAPVAGKLLAADDRKRVMRMEVLAKEEAEREMRQDFVPVRIYAHQARPGRQPGDRVDFTETLYWNAAIRTNDKGEAKVSFALNDSVTAFRVLADAFTGNGALGDGTGQVTSVEPFYVEPKLPLEVTSGDAVDLPVTLVNGLGNDLEKAILEITAGKGVQVSALAPFALRAQARERRLVRVTVGDRVGISDFTIQAQAGPYADKVTRRLSVAPLGFPAQVASGGMLEGSASIRKTIAIPASVVRGSVSTNIAVYPTPVANMTEALARLLQEPYGCFEQTSSTTYPLVMAQQYFISHTGVDPTLVQRGQELLDRGYKRLASFECKQRGYEWFGGDPGHEALSAYGLLEFCDMAQVREVDAKMLTRTREWLLSRRDGKGSFQRNERALDSFGRAPEATTNAYCIWALLESGQTGLEKEIAWVKKDAETSKDAYVLALAANILWLGKDEAAARKHMDELAKLQKETGTVSGAVTSITRSGGEALEIETTSLALLAWMRDPAYAGAVEKSMRYLSDSCKGGRYGSTQSTVLALRAIVNYDKARSRPLKKGTVQLFVDGRNVGEPVPFDEKTQGAIKLPDIGEVFEPGEHAVELKMADGSSMPYSLAVKYHSLTPDSAKECSIRLSTNLSSRDVAEGALTEVNAKVTNLSRDHSPMAVAILGVPGGLEPRHDHLKELVKSGKIDAYEVIGREVVLYWRSLRPEQTVDVAISLVGAVPGSYTGPASRAYLYYTDEFKCWADGLKVAISPRQGR